MPQRNTSEADIPTITPAEAWRRMREEGAVLIDVREPEEYAEGYVKDVMTIPMSVFQERYQEVPQAGDSLFICHTGYRSRMVTNFMRRQGWEHAINVAGGMDAWEAAALPVEYPNQKPQ